MTAIHKQGDLHQREEAYRSKPYRQHRARQPCEACGYAVMNEDGYITQAAHITVGNYARGMKPSDRRTISLCPERLGIEGCHKDFDRNQKTFIRRIWSMTVQERIDKSEFNWAMWDDGERVGVAGTINRNGENND